MIQKKPDKAFILAAGFGTRLRPFTDQYPKPMVKIGGQSLITRILDKLAMAEINDVVINLHYMADTLKEHVVEHVSARSKKMQVYFSYEEEILDTGGGVKKALPYFRDESFYVIAGDAFWEDEADHSVFTLLEEKWKAQDMDILTWIQPVTRMNLTHGVGDYNFDQETGLLRRSVDKTGTHMWTNIRLNTPSIYEGFPEEGFSFLDIMDNCERKGRLHGIEYRGAWHHISTPQDLNSVNQTLFENGKVSGG